MPAAFLLLASCLPIEEPVLPPPILDIPESATYRQVMVSQGDVMLYRDISAGYVPTNEMQLTFPMNDVYIKNIFVAQGDEVNVDDIIAELDREYFLRELEKSDREESWARLNLKQLDERFEQEFNQSSMSGTAADTASYLEQRQKILNEIESIRINRDYLSFESERRVLRSPLNGVVTYVLTFQEGDRSTADQRVANIADQTQSVFMVRGPDTQYLELGGEYNMSIKSEPYTGLVIDPAEHGIDRYDKDAVYLIIPGVDASIFSQRDFATIRVVLAESKDTVYVPTMAVKRSSARIFVYILTDGLRDIRDIEIGLEGNTTIEVLKGLSPGETVILE